MVVLGGLEPARLSSRGGGSRIEDGPEAPEVRSEEDSGGGDRRRSEQSFPALWVPAAVPWSRIPRSR